MGDSAPSIQEYLVHKQSRTEPFFLCFPSVYQDFRDVDDPLTPQMDAEMHTLEQRLRVKEMEVESGMQSFLGADGGGNVLRPGGGTGVWVPIM